MLNLSGGEEHEGPNIRYGVIDLDDMLRDLQHWETMLSSTHMQRPFETLHKGDQYDEIMAKQKMNLASAVSVHYNKTLS